MCSLSHSGNGLPLPETHGYYGQYKEATSEVNSLLFFVTFDKQSF